MRTLEITRPCPPPTMSPAAAFGLDAASNMSMFKFNRRLPPPRDEADDAIFVHDRHVLESVIETRSATSADACPMVQRLFAEGAKVRAKVLSVVAVRSLKAGERPPLLFLHMTCSDRA